MGEDGGGGGGTRDRARDEGRPRRVPDGGVRWLPHREGNDRGGKVGPDLTHIASKPNIAGVLSPVNQENLTKWVRNAPSIKPGIVMPKFEGQLPDKTIDDIVQWLLTLK